MSEIHWWDIIVTLVLGAVLSEFTDWLPKLAERLVRWVARLHPTRAEIREKEWLAILDNLPGKWSKLGFACAHIPVALVTLGHQIIAVWRPKKLSITSYTFKPNRLTGIGSLEIEKHEIVVKSFDHINYKFREKILMYQLRQGDSPSLIDCWEEEKVGE